MDPGTNNYAYSVIRVKLNPFRYEILEHGMIKHRVKEMNGLGVGLDMKRFAGEIRKLKRKYNIDFAIAERFMTRGHGGTTIEAISAMLGIVGLIFGTECCFISAAVWKNAFNKLYDLKKVYTELLKYGIENHRVDAVSIGLYGATLVLEEPKHFEFLKNIRQFKQRIIQKR